MDITAHEVGRGGYIGEMFQPTGGPWGSIMVDQAFEELMKIFVTPKVVEDVKEQNSREWLKFMLSFGTAIKYIQTDNPDTKISVVMSHSWNMSFKKLTGTNITEYMSKTQTGPVYFRHGSLVICHQNSIELFAKPVSCIAEHVSGLFCEPELRDISFVLLVGSFAECKVLQRGLETVLPRGIKLIVPEYPQFAVVKGAVQYGFR